MLRNDNLYKSSDFLDDNFMNRMKSYFNPYEYNFEGNNKDNLNKEKETLKSKKHEFRQLKK